MKNLEAETIKKFSKLDPKDYKKLFPTTKITTNSFIFSNRLVLSEITKENRDS